MEFVEYEKDKFYSDEAIECGVCGCKSNLFYMRYWVYNSPLGKRIVCPGYKEKKELHNRLDNLISNKQDTRKGHPSKYLEWLVEEIEELREQFKDIEPSVYGGDEIVNAYKITHTFIVFESEKESAKLSKICGGEKITSIKYNKENVFIVSEFLLGQLDYLETGYRRLNKSETNSFLDEKGLLLLALRK